MRNDYRFGSNPLATLSTFHSQLLFCPYRALVYYYVGCCPTLMPVALSGRFDSV
ncbi:MAG: hypothetical protein LBE12_01640 [Planctomycetaceae bacterium]|nr:hypothetical protein [Planctomycetaceae bacterium]